MSNLNLDFWRGKKVLLTGSTGFKGSWLTLLLHHRQVAGYALSPETEPNLYQQAGAGKLLKAEITADIRDTPRLKSLVHEFRPDIVLHMAAQALVQPSLANPVETYSVNVLGTASVLEALRHQPSIRSVAVVTTDKCYWNDNQHVAFREDDRLGGKDPYSASKAATELVVQSYYSSFLHRENPEQSVLTLRAGNIIGGGDWSQDRLIPDIIRAAFEKKPLVVRMPHAIRPWQYVLDALRGYLLAIENSFKQPGKMESFNFAPPAYPQITVGEILAHAEKFFPHLKWSVPSGIETREAGTLSLDALKAFRDLKWRPLLGPDELFHRTFNWYSQYYQEQAVGTLCQSEIETHLARES